MYRLRDSIERVSLWSEGRPISTRHDAMGRHRDVGTRLPCLFYRLSDRFVKRKGAYVRR